MCFGDPGGDFLLVVGVVDGKHGDAVGEGGEAWDWGAADAGGGGVGVGEVWVGFFEGGEFGEEAIKLCVRDERICVGVVGGIGAFEQGSEFVDAGFLFGLVGHWGNDMGGGL